MRTSLIIKSNYAGNVRNRWRFNTRRPWIVLLYNIQQYATIIHTVKQLNRIKMAAVGLRVIMRNIWLTRSEIGPTVYDTGRNYRQFLDAVIRSDVRGSGLRGLSNPVALPSVGQAGGRGGGRRGRLAAPSTRGFKFQPYSQQRFSLLRIIWRPPPLYTGLVFLYY